MDDLNAPINPQDNINMFQQLAEESMGGFDINQMQEMAYAQLIAKLDELLETQKHEIEGFGPEELKNHQLPLARVKKIMKSDEDVRMISAEAPALFGKACELFIIELTHRSWIYTEESKRRTLQRSDIKDCIERTDIYDFLQDIVPQESRT